MGRTFIIAVAAGVASTLLALYLSNNVASVRRVVQ